MYCIITKKNIIISSLIIFMLFVSAATYCIYATSSSSSWGLHFDKDNTTPTGNASEEELLEYNAYYVGDTSEKKIYLTFDVGYEAGYTENILDTLLSYNVKATFFVVGNYFDSNPETIKRMYEEGHIVANHTLTHPDMSKMSYEDFVRELEGVEEKYKEITGDNLKKFYRPPQGIYSTQNLEYASKLGYTTVFWSVAYVDWERDNQPSLEYAMNILLKRVHNGAIILLHSTSKTNMEILDEFISTLLNDGYTFCTVEDLIC